ncbi:MAG: hypothetical protein GX548_01405 [Lentisphaerae bacterium]|nr:hypothetical protein [Lentisphaerota bacterium]
MEMLSRIGLALGAGVLIFIVPLAYRKGRWAPHRISRVVYFVISAGSLIAFLFYASYLWNRFVPREPEAPAPLAYPAPPPSP